MFSITISPPIPIIKNYGNSGRLIKRKHTLMLSIENNFSNDNIFIETKDFKSVIYNQPVDNNFTLYFVKTHYVLANLLLALVRGTEAQSKANWSIRKFSPFAMAPISLIDHDSEVSEPLAGSSPYAVTSGLVGLLGDIKNLVHLLDEHRSGAK